MTHRHGRNINANHGVRIFKGIYLLCGKGWSYNFSAIDVAFNLDEA
jgi:hypothetical protein